MRTKNSWVPKALLFTAIAYSLVLLMLSLMNLKSLPQIELMNIDKVYHATAYFGLVNVWFLQYYANSSSTKWFFRPLLFICFFATVFGILVEVLQGVATSYRTWDKFDMLANFTGVLLALVFLFTLRNTLERLKMKI